jgi:hypothetical protein
MFHVSASANRWSILRHGLDWTQMGAATGIAGSRQPELEGIFLCDSREGADFFVNMGRTKSDIWAVDVDGVWLEGAPGAGGGGDWLIMPERAGPSRLRLLERDVVPSRHTRML